MTAVDRPARMRPEALAARAGVVRAGVRSSLPVRSQCDRCGDLAKGDSAAITHVLRYPSHTVTVASLATTVYRHPTRVQKGSSS